MSYDDLELEDEFEEDEPRDWLKGYLQVEWLDDAAEERYPELTGKARLSLRGTPVFRTHRTMEEILNSMPGYIGTSGASYLFRAPDGEVIVFMEDWMSGCIPKQLSMLSLTPYAEREVREYCVNAMLPRRDAITAALEEDGWELAVDEPLVCDEDYEGDDEEDDELGEECYTRFAWIK